MNRNYHQINKKLKDIFKDRFNLDICHESFLNKQLLGKEIGLQPRDLIYLFFDVENTFGIKIKEEYIVTHKFDTFDNICEIICNELGIVEK